MSAKEHPDIAAIDAEGFEVYDESELGVVPDGFDADEPVFVDPDFVTVPEEYLGQGWCDTRVSSLKDGVNLTKTAFYRTVPRPFDKTPDDVPNDHPLRAIAKVLDDSPTDSIIRVKAYLLTDFWAIDLLLHYASERKMRIIIDDASRNDVEHAAAQLQEADQKNDNKLRARIRKFSVNSLSKFLGFYERQNSHLLFGLVRIRVADRSQQHCCPHKLSSMHEKTVITPHSTVTGSYNLTGYARCKNWESVRVVVTLQEEIDAFDAAWNALGPARDIASVYPNSLPERAHKKLRTEE
jgi:hypothetical protein